MAEVWVWRRCGGGGGVGVAEMWVWWRCGCGGGVAVAEVWGWRRTELIVTGTPARSRAGSGCSCIIVSRATVRGPIVSVALSHGE